jgi:hypothetical protein
MTKSWDYSHWFALVRGYGEEKQEAQTEEEPSLAKLSLQIRRRHRISVSKITVVNGHQRLF